MQKMKSSTKKIKTRLMRCLDQLAAMRSECERDAMPILERCIGDLRRTLSAVDDTARPAISKPEVAPVIKPMAAKILMGPDGGPCDYPEMPDGFMPPKPKTDEDFVNNTTKGWTGYYNWYALKQGRKEFQWERMTWSEQAEYIRLQAIHIQRNHKDDDDVVEF